MADGDHRPHLQRSIAMAHKPTLASVIQTSFQRKPLSPSRSVSGKVDSMDNASMAWQHESEFVRAFVIRERHERYLSRLASAKHRHALLDRLNHRFMGDLDARWVVQGKRRWPADQDLCYLIAYESTYDQRFVSLAEAEEAMSNALFGIVASFIPGKLACYKDEAPANVVWLQRD
jgi:hypothetical protein